MAQDEKHNQQATASGGLSLQPDAPFRSGAPGKYKLLVKHVEKKPGRYEYELSDAEGRTYSAESQQYYPENQLLRCVVTFSVKSAKLVLMGTAICKNQDLIVPVAIPRPAETSKASFIPTQFPFVEGSPRKHRKNGSYRLVVEFSMPWNDPSAGRFLYLLADESGLKYHSVSDLKYAKGTKLVCRVEVVKTNSGELYFVAISDDDSSKAACMIDRKIVLRKDYVQLKATPHPKPSPVKQKQKSRDVVALRNLRDKYKKGERYLFTVTGRRDRSGNQIVRDASGYEHVLVGTTVSYSVDDEVRCTVTGFSFDSDVSIGSGHALVSSPRIVKNEEFVSYIKSPGRWHSEVQGLGKHKCGKAFTCSCCGRNFPANAGVRVDLKDIYFCNSCARKIYEPVGRGNHHIYISTPMGNKR